MRSRQPRELDRSGCRRTETLCAPVRLVVMRLIIATVLGLLAIPSTAVANIIIAIDKSNQSMTVIVDGDPRWVWPVSTGRRGYATPEGSFGAFRMEVDHYSREWDDAPMPHSIFFTKRGHAIHGTYEVGRLGTPASHGCVRLSTENAARLFGLVRQYGMKTTQVVVTGSETFSTAPEAKRVRSRESRRYEYPPGSWAPARRVAPWSPPQWGPHHRF